MDGAFPSERGQPFDNGGRGRGPGGGRGFRGTAENAKVGNVFQPSPTTSVAQEVVLA